jgi:negative regulator of flagellin synthesis FlgM
MQIYGPSQLHGAQSIHGPHTARAIESAPQPGPTHAASDRLEISEAGRIAGQLAEIPDIRSERVESIRAAILNGTYETDEKLDIALERLLDEIA